MKKIQVTLFVLLVLALSVSAAEIEGEVMDVSSGNVVEVAVPGDFLPCEGDEVTISFDLPDVGPIALKGSWQVTQIADNKVFASPATDEVSQPQAGQRVTIHSPNPQKREVDIKAIQTQLQALGYDPGPLDGKMGNKTRHAIKQFQQNKGLAVDGRPTYSLFVLLSTSEPENTDKHDPDNEDEKQVLSAQDDIKAIQTQLQALGYDPGPLDGKMGNRTRNAIKQFQKDKDLAVDGRPTRKLYNTLCPRVESPEENYQHGLDYYNGDNELPRDYVKAVDFFWKAAEKEHMKGQYNLGVMCVRGYGTDQDDDEACRFFRKASEQGCAEAQYNLGIMYIKGWGVPKNDGEAVTWFRKAAQQHLAPAQYALGLMYKRGRGVAKDNATALFWFRKAADQNFAPAQYVLGLMYEEGINVAKNDAQARSLYRKAAAQGSYHARNRLQEQKTVTPVTLRQQ